MSEAPAISVVDDFVEEQGQEGTVWKFHFTDGSTCSLLEVVNGVQTTPYFRVKGTITPSQKAAVERYSILKIKEA